MSKTQLTPEERDILKQRRRVEYDQPYDFAPYHGICHSCRYDLLAHYGDRWPTAYVTGCPSCNRSYCD